jgi:hypothetical protein
MWTFGMHISADVGSLFDVIGAFDFTVHSKDMSLFWGIELLREADRIDGHIKRFQPGGRYQNLGSIFAMWIFGDNVRTITLRLIWRNVQAY